MFHVSCMYVCLKQPEWAINPWFFRLLNGRIGAAFMKGEKTSEKNLSMSDVTDWIWSCRKRSIVLERVR
jgi:hypothetical protein